MIAYLMGLFALVALVFAAISTGYVYRLGFRIARVVRELERRSALRNNDRATRAKAGDRNE